MQHRFYLSRFLCISCASFALVGCSYFNTEPGRPILEMPQSEEVVEYSDRFVDLSSVVYENTGGRVQLFDLDEHVPAPAYQPVASVEMDAMEIAPATVMPVGQVYATMPFGSIVSADPSVEIFPFEDMTPVPVSAQMARPYASSLRGEGYVAVGASDRDTVVVYFGHDSATLNQKGLAKVSRVAEAFNAASGIGLTVEGHASVMANYNSAAQRKVVNLKISMDRAFAVARALIDKGVPADFIRVMAWGDAKPAQNLDGKTPEEAARRVEISR